MKASYHRYILDFKQPSGTSRGILIQKETWFIKLENNGKRGIGECGILRGLSCDDRIDYEEKLKWVCENIDQGFDFLYHKMIEFPSIQMGLETAFLSINSEDPYLIFPSDFTSSNDNIEINGLIWMGDKSFMMKQLEDKLAAGFKCIKMKVGALDFKQEIEVLKAIRSKFSPKDIVIRVDANGAFTLAEALEKLNKLSEFGIHSIEQPIKQGQIEAMSYLCKNTPIPIALDEELIGVFEYEEKKLLLDAIKPQYIILKPSFIGGFRGSMEWINLAESDNIGWWVTSALESNVGLNAISQWTYTLNPSGPQGLGTGSLYTNNIDSPLEVKNGYIVYDKFKKWSEIQ
ncbi:o-succinylbenzoate synthase [Flavobacteriaceae bacterium]|uniref:o-succinylbenzoate synthase n=1 Tax=Candidatus Arcticimaribacter forsetii TaxID=2820661 RepID=UPI0020772D8A|nr:o-succinylbenzoate synthase [Candidatus Arcticimaribacter forsetii]MDB2325467.1 o-succinylbenzoate synthase [Flavobacteriaceae bacterium]MDB4751721.1 o-succinylbenzoate synthase [Flavobacteriaceae bacterium]